MKYYDKIKEKTQRVIVKKILYGLGDASKENLVRLATLIEKLIKDRNKKSVADYKDERGDNIVSVVKKMIKEDRPSIGLIRRILKDIHPNCREKFVENFIINRWLIYKKRKEEFHKKEGVWPPMSVLISPTMRCNLKCEGCYAGNYSKDDDLGFELFDRIVTEAEEMGISLFTILGGEPFVIKDDLFKIAKKHSTSYFQAFTNGTLIDKEVIEKLKEAGNILMNMSVEGFEKETDERRGKGTFKTMMKAMDLLKENKIPFGFSTTVTSKNAELICSDKFIDFMIKKGAYLGWFFLYMPIGSEPNLDLMPTPEQRILLKNTWERMRKEKSIFLVDFWNDAPYVGGCIAGREYIHITSKGDVEPCIFSHFAVDNIKNKSLKEAFTSDFFKGLREREPHSENLYMPCMWIDTPEAGREIWEKFGCYPTHEGADTIVKDPKIIKGLNKYSKRVKELFDPEWEKRKAETKNC
ncbi:MAG: radical SAM protein [archaeon]